MDQRRFEMGYQELAQARNEAESQTQEAAEKAVANSYKNELREKDVSAEAELTTFIETHIEGAANVAEAQKQVIKFNASYPQMAGRGAEEAVQLHTFDATCADGTKMRVYVSEALEKGFEMSIAAQTK